MAKNKKGLVGVFVAIGVALYVAMGGTHTTSDIQFASPQIIPLPKSVVASDGAYTVSSGATLAVSGEGAL